MVSNVECFEYILTDSEFEALVLEYNLIKLHKPKYNILLKDDKGYHYIRISGGDWPRISEANVVADDGAHLCGALCQRLGGEGVPLTRPGRFSACLPVTGNSLRTSGRDGPA